MVPVGSMLIAIAMHTNSLVVVAARRRGIHLQKELIIAMARGLVP